MKKAIFILSLTSFLFACNQAIEDNFKKETDEINSTTTETTSRILKPNGTRYTNEELEAMSHNDLMMLTYEQPKDTILTIGILLYDGYFSLDAMGPHSVLSSMYPAKTFFIAKEKGIVTSNNGLRTPVDTTITEVKQLDILLVPGGSGETHRAAKDKELIEWIKAIDQNSKYTTSVCTGSLILGAAGLLKGRKATTNWYRAKERTESYGATFIHERYTHDGKYWTSAGVSAGIDMSLALVDHIMGRNYADFVMLNLEYDPAPPFDGGSPDKADPVVMFMTKKMYDIGRDSVIEELKEN